VRKMDKQKKKEMKLEYKEMETFFGVIQIKNIENGKIFIDAVPNLRNRWHFYKLNLNNQFYINTDLQKDWNNYGEDHFVYDVLYKKEASKVENVRLEVKKIKDEWLEKLQPYGESGYNQIKKER